VWLEEACFTILEKLPFVFMLKEEVKQDTSRSRR
jgi:hypothetical protein